MNLARTILQRSDLLHNKTILVCGVGAVLFTLLPYIANVRAASRVRVLVAGNEAAATWFKHNAALFGALVIVTGGCFPALAVVSSNMFGHALLSSGLTKFELSALSRIRLWNTVILENIPQLVFQVVYTVEIGELETEVLIAFFASILSVCMSTLGYVIARNVAGMVPVQYDLKVECNRGDANEDDDITNSQIQQSTPDPNERVANQITEREEKDIIERRGLRQKLAKTLSALFGIQPKALEIGATLCTKHGASTHCVQFVDVSRLQAMSDDLSDANHGVIDVSAERRVERMYRAVKKEMDDAVLTHFNLCDFEVKLVLHRYRDGRGRNAGGAQARLRLALKDFLEHDSAAGVETMRATVQRMVDETFGDPIGVPEREGNSKAEHAQETAVRTELEMATRPENSVDALFEAIEDSAEDSIANVSSEEP